jgi:predicted nucleic acid-binding protein
MTARYFVDTNLLIYVFGSRRAEGHDPRRDRAQELLLGKPCISVQVLNEFVDVCWRKVKLTWDEINGYLEVIEELCHSAIPVSYEVHRSALKISMRHGLRIYDSLIVAAALESGCDTLYTEDMQHGQVIEGVRIENPFV